VEEEVRKAVEVLSEVEEVLDGLIESCPGPDRVWELLGVARVRVAAAKVVLEELLEEE